MTDVEINQNEKQRFDGLVSDFFDLSKEQEKIRIASWNCSSGFTTQFEHFQDFMKTRAEPYIDILCLQGFPMGNKRKHDRIFKLFEECGFTYVYGESSEDFFVKTMTLFKRSFLELYSVIPDEGQSVSNVEIYYIKSKSGFFGDNGCSNHFLLSNVYLHHGCDKFKSLDRIDAYGFELWNPHQIIIGDFNYDVHKDRETQISLCAWSKTPDIPTSNGYRADHILSDIDIKCMVDERFTRGTYNKGYIHIPGNHFHQPIYGWFLPSKIGNEIPYFKDDVLIDPTAGAFVRAIPDLPT
tara:strand:- start:46 stop:933 length:888 start_codon:yes stop_codon:yes gene_type:complete